MYRRRRQQPGAKSPPPHSSSSSSSSSTAGKTEEADVEQHNLKSTSSTIRRRRQSFPDPAAAEAAEEEDDEKKEEETAQDSVTVVDQGGSGTTEVEPWGDKAPAKVLLRSLLEEESSWVRSEWNKGENQEPKESQASRIERIRNKNPLFKQYDKTLFYNNFRRLMTTIDDEKIAVAFDKLAFDKEHKKWPINGTLPNGKPRWQDSQAQKQLRDDLKDPEKKNRKPQQLYYDEFQLERF